MRVSFASSALLLALCSCASAPRIVDPRDAAELRFDRLIDELAMADVVVLGEIHDNMEVHDEHLRILKALATRRPLVLSMEMFERDVQAQVYQYLAGAMTETEFLAGARPWPHYKTDYRPLVEFAKANGIPVIAANVPRPLAAEVAKAGLAAAVGNADAAAEVTAPKDEYWESFAKEMGGHGGAGDDGKMQRYYESQCLKDDTMAESIVQALQGSRERTPDAQLVHVCGKFHSDFRRGTVARVLSRMPKLKVAVLSAEAVDDPGRGDYQLAGGVADYVLVVRPSTRSAAKAAPPMASTKVAAGAGELPPRHPPIAQTAGEPAPSPHAAAAGGRPALGFRPDEQNADAVVVSALRPDGSAEKAGMKEGDIILAIGKQDTPDMQAYVEVLGEQEIGSKVKVTVLRDGKMVELSVEVGSR